MQQSSLIFESVFHLHHFLYLFITPKEFYELHKHSKVWISNILYFFWKEMNTFIHQGCI